MPNFGKDNEIQSLDESLSLAEKQVGAKFDAASLEQPKPFKNNYFVPNFGQDFDIKDSFSNLASAEKTTGISWNVDFSAVQLDSSLERPHYSRNVMMMSDPITDSTGEYTQYTHPDNGDKKWKMNYPVPNFGVDQEVLSDKENVAAVEKDMGHVFVPKESGDPYKMNYVVPNFGQDPDMIASR